MEAVLNENITEDYKFLIKIFKGILSIAVVILAMLIFCAGISFFMELKILSGLLYSFFGIVTISLIGLINKPQL